MVSPDLFQNNDKLTSKHILNLSYYLVLKLQFKNVIKVVVLVRESLYVL